MKKLIVLATVFMMCSLASLQVKSYAQDKNNSDIENIQLAFALADYGWQNDSATALLQAAEIFSGVRIVPLDEKSSSLTIVSVANASTIRQETSATALAEKMISDARRLANKDKNISVWAERIEKNLKSKKRGATGGAKFHFNYIEANDTVVYHISYDGGRLAEMFVYSLDDADIDVNVYDACGEFIASDKKNKKDAYAYWKPERTQKFTIEIVNNSARNAAFSLYTN